MMFYFTHDAYQNMFWMKTSTNNRILVNFLFWCVLWLAPATFSNLRLVRNVYQNWRKEQLYSFQIKSEKKQIILPPKNTKTRNLRPNWPKMPINWTRIIGFTHLLDSAWLHLPCWVHFNKILNDFLGKHNFIMCFRLAENTCHFLTFEVTQDG